MRTLVTGLSGFVGQHLAARLPTDALTLDGEPVDIAQPAPVLAALDELRPDAVVHLAAQTHVPSAVADPTTTYQVNVLGTLNLLQALRQTGFRGRLLYISSGDVYGLVPESRLPIDEQLPPNPLNPYAASKLAAEALTRQWGAMGPFEVVIARPFNHIGPAQDPRFAIADFARQAALVALGRQEPTLAVGDIDATRDFTDVRDVVDAYVALLQRGRPGETYNVCSGAEHSLREAISIFSELIQVPLACSVQTERLRRADQRRVRGAFDKLNTDTGWAPTMSFRQTLNDTLQHWLRTESA